MTSIRMITGFLVASAVLAVGPAAAANAIVERNMVERQKLEEMAGSANKPREHVTVAKQYRLQAEKFEQKAAKHEAEARRLEAAPRSPIAYKWPAMAGQPHVRERQLAMEARRAAKECLEASDRHLLLSVEKLAEVVDKGQSRPSDVD